MKRFNPMKAFQQIRAESQQQKQATEEWAQRERQKWAAYGTRSRAFNQLMQLFPREAAGTLDIPKAVALMVEFAQTIPTEWLKARVRFVSDCLAKLPGYSADRASFKEIALNLLLVAKAGDHARVAEIFTEAVRGDPDDVESFRLCLSNWLVDKVVDGWPPLPDELNPPTETSVDEVEVPSDTLSAEEERLPSEPLPEQTPSGTEPTPNANTTAKVTKPSPDQPITSPRADDGEVDRPIQKKERLGFDPQTQTITLDGTPYEIGDPKAFAVYQALACACPTPLTKSAIQKRVPGCRGDKKIPGLLDGLPKPLRVTVRSGSNGYWLNLNPPAKPGKRRRRKNGGS
jgi:hypothetical protein